MTLRAFVKKNRKEIDEWIHYSVPALRLNDEEREKWVLNNEGLYNWARSEGVDI